MKNILVVDNYDSFTYNLVYLLRKYADVTVLKNDQINSEQAALFDKLLFSPGPGIPVEAGNMCPLIKDFVGLKPMLGICLGHQAIGEVFGGQLKNLSHVYHGVATSVTVKSTDAYIFNDIPAQFNAGRYHSWVVDNINVPDTLEITATDNSGMIMGLKHKKYDINGLQFHPESIMTEHGEKLIENWVNH
jgi:anthranilate synthase component II